MNESDIIITKSALYENLTNDSSVYLYDIYAQDLPYILNVTKDLTIKENSTIVANNYLTEDSSTTYSISGDDSSLFSIDSSTGALNFLNAPDYENPIDTGNNNIYNITLSAENSGNQIDYDLNIKMFF